MRERHLLGRAELASLIGHLQDRGGLSNSQLAAICDWALNEPSPIHKSTVSHLRNRNYARGASLPVLEAIATANRAIHCWTVAGPEQANHEFGPHQIWGVTADTLDRAVWLPSRNDETQPLDLCDLVAVAIGAWSPAWLMLSLARDEGAQLSGELADLLWTLVADMPARDALVRILAACPDVPETRAAVAELLSGQTWTSDEIEERIAEMAATVAALQGKPAGSLTPTALLAQLSAGRRRT